MGSAPFQENSGHSADCCFLDGVIRGQNIRILLISLSWIVLESSHTLVTESQRVAEYIYNICSIYGQKRANIARDTLKIFYTMKKTKNNFQKQSTIHVYSKYHIRQGSPNKSSKIQ